MGGTKSELGGISIEKDLSKNIGYKVAANSQLQVVKSHNTDRYNLAAFKGFIYKNLSGFTHSQRYNDTWAVADITWHKSFVNHQEWWIYTPKWEQQIFLFPLLSQHWLEVA